MADAARPPRPLSRDLIVDAALEMAEEGGLGRVTLRPLAARLGVTATALYDHVESRANLLALVLERRVVARYRPLPDGVGWADALRWTAGTMWDVYVPIGGLAAATLAGQISAAATRGQARELLDLLEADGFSPEDAARAAFCFVHWALSFIAGVEHRPPEGEGYAEVPGRDPGPAREVFDQGVELLVLGLEAQAATGT